MDLVLPSSDVVADRFFHASKLCLTFDSSQSLRYVQAIIVYGYYAMNGTHQISGGDSFWPLLRMAMGIVEALGLHRDDMAGDLSAEERIARRINSGKHTRKRFYKVWLSASVKVSQPTSFGAHLSTQMATVFIPKLATYLLYYPASMTSTSVWNRPCILKFWRSMSNSALLKPLYLLISTPPFFLHHHIRPVQLKNESLANAISCLFTSTKLGWPSIGAGLSSRSMTCILTPWSLLSRYRFSRVWKHVETSSRPLETWSPCMVSTSRKDGIISSIYFRLVCAWLLSVSEHQSCPWLLLHWWNWIWALKCFVRLDERNMWVKSAWMACADLCRSYASGFEIVQSTP